jgi:hypothetical protein
MGQKRVVVLLQTSFEVNSLGRIVLKDTVADVASETC